MAKKLSSECPVHREYYLLWVEMRIGNENKGEPTERKVPKKQLLS